MVRMPTQPTWPRVLSSGEDIKRLKEEATKKMEENRRKQEVREREVRKQERRRTGKNN